MFYVLALAVFVASVSGDDSIAQGRFPVLVLSFDGLGVEVAKKMDFWALYKSKAASPNFVKSVFPTKTFSTHFSVATGVKPAVHGVIGNVQFDKNGKRVYNHPNQYRNVPDIKPIWIQNEISTRKSGTMMWPGAQFQYGGTVQEAEKPFTFGENGDEEDEEKDDSSNDDDNYQDGKRAHYHVDYKPKSMAWEKRADKIIEWLTCADKANLVMAYFENFRCVDKAKIDDVKKEHIKKVDGIIQYIYDELVKNHLDEKIDIIIMSDHGTHPTKAEDILTIDDILGLEDDHPNSIILSGPLAYLFPESRDYDKAIEKLNEGSGNGEKYKVYKKSELKWDMDKLDILEKVITVVANPPYTFASQQILENIEDNYNIEKESIVQDVNGYDNEVASMNGFFYGIGPSFKNDEHLKEKHLDLDNIYMLIKVLIDLPLETSSSVQKNNNVDEVIKLLLEPGIIKS